MQNHLFAVIGRAHRPDANQLQPYLSEAPDADRRTLDEWHPAFARFVDGREITPDQVPPQVAPWMAAKTLK